MADGYGTASGLIQQAEDRVRQGRYDDAAALYNRALEADPGNKRARKGLRTLRNQRGGALSRDDFDRVMRLMQLGKAEAALADINNLCQHFANQPALHNLRGVVLSRSGMLAQASLAFRKALSLEPDFPEAMGNLASTLNALERPKEALACYQALVNRGIADADVLGNLARALRADGQLENALEAMKRALQLSPLSPDSYNELGNILAASGQHREAKQAYETALGINPRHAQARENLARAASAVQTKAAPAPDVAMQVRLFFEKQAPHYDKDRSKAPRYRLPERIPTLLEKLDGVDAWYPHTMDIGCGTGLAGTQIRSYCEQLRGLDLSEAMLKEAKTKAVYDELSAGDGCDLLSHMASRFDLLIAADVLPYFPRLEPIFACLGRAGNPGARVVVSTELSEDSDHDPRADLRFGHSEREVLRCAAVAGLAPRHIEDCILRKQGDQTIRGQLFVFSKTASASHSPA